MRCRILPVATLAVITLFSANASAQVRYGGQLNLADDVDLGIGARAAFSLSEYVEGMDGVVSFDLFFPGRNTSYWELNGFVTFQMPVENTGDYHPYLGGGLRLAHFGFDPDNPAASDISETKLGLTLAVGTRFPSVKNWAPFVELRLPLGGQDATDFMLVAGLFF